MSVQAPARTPQGGVWEKKEGGNRDDWCAPSNVENPLQRFFSSSESGKANTARIAAIKIRHHRKIKTDWTNTKLCIKFAIGMKCSLGRLCNLNHQSQKQAQQIQKDKEKVISLDNIFHAIYN